MQNRFSTIALVTALMGVGFESQAEAAITWRDSPLQYATGACGGGTYALIGYQHDPGVFPQTGDTGYVRLYAQTTASCSDTVSLEVRLPAGMVQAPGSTVLCYRGAVGATGMPLANYPTSEGACFQTPNANPAYSTVQYAWSKLTGNQWVEIWIPVAYTRRMSGASLSGLINGGFAPLQPIITPIDVPYRPLFSNYVAANSIGPFAFGAAGTNQLTMSFRLEHFHEAAQVFVDYGTTTNLGSSTGPVPAEAQFTLYSTFNMPTISYLPSGTTYYWRPRIVTAFGTYYGAMQTATTYYEIVNPNPTPPIYCRRGGC